MVYYYLLVFLGAFLFDVVPFPFLPAFTIMVFLQMKYDLNIWWVISIGAVASVLGRYVLTLYISALSVKIFKPAKNEDIQFLGRKMKEKGWKGQASIITYSLLPLPTTPLFLAAGMSKINSLYIIPAFFIGKFTSDAIAVHLGNYTSENISTVAQEGLNWPSITGLAVGFLFICFILFIDWRTLIQKKEFQLKFKIWK